jgi:hypothetical protein
MAQYGPPFDFSKLDKILDRVMSTPKFEVLVGYPTNSGQHEGGKITNATLAAIHDLGAPGAGIEARPFLRQSVLNRRNQYTTQLGNDLRRAYRGEITVDAAYGRLALAAEAGVKLEITHPSPAFKALDAATSKRKNSSVPLIDSGQLRSSAMGVVRKAGQTR